MAFDFKTATPDATFTPATAFLFGADSQSAADPSIYQGSTVFNALLALANTWTATQTITPAANTAAMVVSGYSLTGSDATSLLDLSGTWNTSGTPTAIKLNITNTSSPVGALLMDLQTGGVSQFRVARSNSVVTAGNFSVGGQCFSAGLLKANTTSAIPSGGSTNIGFFSTTATNFGVLFGSGAPTVAAAKGSLYLRSDGTTTNDRAYINTDGSTTWTALTTAA